MTGLFGCGIRRTVGVVGAVVALLLIAAPAALAFGDTITAQATVQFSGAVDNPASCTGATSATIDWGDGTPTSTGTPSRTNVVSGTHTYATNAGTLRRHGHPHRRQLQQRHRGLLHGQRQPGAADVHTVPGRRPNNGCQFLITINSGTELVTQDPNQGPYEGADDSLIGVQNNSSSPVSALPLSVPGSELFSFDEDGICDPGTAPRSAGLRPAGGGAGGHGLPGVRATNCSFPAPAGEPAGYVEPGAPAPASPRTATRARRAGSRTSRPTSPPASSTSRRRSRQADRLTSASRSRRSARTSASAAPRRSPAGCPRRRSSSTGASFSAVVNPNGQATTAYFQYGLDLKYSKLGGSGPTTRTRPPCSRWPATSTTTS